jgi:hypothetical protein
MPVNFDKLLSHPDCEEIISKLVSGIQPKDISEYLKIKYQGKEEQHLRLSAASLKEFIESNLDFYATLNNDIKAVKNGTIDTKKISTALKNNKTYQERMLEAVDEEIDIKKMFKSIYVLLNARVEQYFDKMMLNPENLKPDYGLLKYFEQMMNYCEKYDKVVMKSPDQIIQHNVTVQVMDQYVMVMQDSIRQTLAEMDADAANLFMERFNENLSKLQLPEGLQPTKPQTQDQKYRGAELLQAKLEELNPNGE